MHQKQYKGKNSAKINHKKAGGSGRIPPMRSYWYFSCHISTLVRFIMPRKTKSTPHRSNTPLSNHLHFKIGQTSTAKSRARSFFLLLCSKQIIQCNQIVNQFLWISVFFHPICRDDGDKNLFFCFCLIHKNRFFILKNFCICLVNHKMILIFSAYRCGQI